MLEQIARRQTAPMTPEQRTTARLATELATYARGDVGYEQARAAYEADAVHRLARVSGVSVDALRTRWDREAAAQRGSAA